MTRILFIAHSSKLGGPAKSLLTLIEHLQPCHAAGVVVPGDGDFTDLLRERGLPVYVSSLRLRELPRLIMIMQRGGYALAYGNAFTYRVSVGLSAARWLRRPYLWHIREMIGDPAQAQGREREFLSASRRVMLGARRVIAVSQAAAVGAQRLTGGRVPVDVVYNGVDLEDFDMDRAAARAQLVRELCADHDDVIALSVGYLDPRKNQLDALDAVARALADAPSLRLALLGDDAKVPDYTARVQERIAALDIADRVHVLGFHANVAHYLRGADILVHTATQDPHPRAVIEAMAAGLPIVTYGVDGVGETVIDGDTGLLAPLGNIDGLTHSLRRLAVDHGLREQMGARGRAVAAESFAAEQTAARIAMIIDAVLEQA